MKKIYLSLILSLPLFSAEHELSKFVVHGISHSKSNETAYGVTNSYALLYAKHELSTIENSLHLSYGAKVGIISEDYSSQDGFGIPLNKLGTYLAASLELNYDLSHCCHLLAEGSYAQDEVHELEESLVKLSYNYTF